VAEDGAGVLGCGGVAEDGAGGLDFGGVGEGGGGGFGVDGGGLGGFPPPLGRRRSSSIACGVPSPSIRRPRRSPLGMVKAWIRMPNPKSSNKLRNERMCMAQ